MDFGIMFANTGPFAEPAAAASMARAAEAAGFESLWTVEHVVVPAGYQSAYPYSRDGKMPGPEDSAIPDPIVWLSYLAGVTERIRLATGVMILPQRNPVVFAKEIATLSQLSSGRVELGVGVGWLEEEFDAIGVPFRQRGRLTDEHIEAMRALWTQKPATFSGPTVSFTDCHQEPKPVGGHVPIHVGGHSEAAAKRAGRLGDGFFPASGTHDQLRELIGLAWRTAEEAGRDPDAIEITSGGSGVLGPQSLDEVEALAELGVSRVIVPAFLFYSGAEEAIERFGAEVIAEAG